MNQVEQAMDGMWPVFEPTRGYRVGGGGADYTEVGYRSAMLEMAILKDSLPMIKDAIKRGWINAECKCFDGSFVVDYCERQRGATKVGTYLRSLGWPCWAPRAA